MDYLKEIKAEFPDIKPYCENDFEWDNEAYEFLKNKDIVNAEILFKKLCLSQPQAQTGFEGLAYVNYLKKDKDKSLWFMEEALKRAKDFLKTNAIDQEIIDGMEVNYYKIKNDEEISAWWNNNLEDVSPENKNIIKEKKKNKKTKKEKIGRNNPCPCGSGKKYKRCCGK